MAIGGRIDKFSKETMFVRGLSIFDNDDGTVDEVGIVFIIYYVLYIYYNQPFPYSN